jgi:hypothetical protein
MDRDALARLMAQQQLRPLRGNERRLNPDGSYSTEITATDQDPQGLWEVYPTLWMSPNGPVELRSGPAMQAANAYEKRGYRFPRFSDLDTSERWATSRSKGGGAATPLASVVGR